MVSKNTIKYIRSLQYKKFRQKYNNFVVEGDKIATEILHCEDFEVEAVFALDSWIHALPENIPIPLDKLVLVSPRELQQLSSLKSPNCVLLVGKQSNFRIEKGLINDHFNLYLDRIQDPGNMGTILRIADWFGWPYVFCSLDCADLYNSKVIQSSMGAFLRVKVVSINFDLLLNTIGEIPVLGAGLKGKDVFNLDLPKEGIIVIGNESKGISANIVSRITQQISIPRSPKGRAESLNAAVATGIICAVINNRIN